MKPLIIVALMLSCATAVAQVYKCPDYYPSKAIPAVHLSNATMYLGELHGNGVMHGDIEQIKGGTDIHYNFPEEAPRWLVCQYGGKRVNGTAISGAQVIGGRNWWMRLDRFIDVCDLEIREKKANNRGASGWTAIATCKGKALPPPVMLE
ncbi:STY0301 family protein [Massilia horti]|uniref:Uncharacterized protein n=1 Tax=Massilia horti TaxID=2562153 RepID=A0A4Y9T524_9BURK|nr:STY0301 family protein [Massilia horti]TFW35989.1 hypothetical protein E4O92_00745 [Massilia horti]